MTDAPEQARQLLSEIVRLSSAWLEDEQTRNTLSSVRNQERLRAVLGEADEFHQQQGGGVAIGDLETFLVETACGR